MAGPQGPKVGPVALRRPAPASSGANLSCTKGECKTLSSTKRGRALPQIYVSGSAAAGLCRECFVANFVENLAEFDGLFSNINCLDEVPDEVPDEGTKG